MSKDLTSSMKDMKVSKKTGDSAAAKARRRLSVAAAANAKSYSLDGVGSKGSSKTQVDDSKDCGRITKHSSLGKVGYVPGNAGKVNQDRCVVTMPYMDDPSKSFWGVFDGHGSVGHEASQYTADHLPKCCAKYLKDGKYTVEQAMDKGFVECNTNLSKSATDCTFSGTTVITVYIDGDTMYSSNAGDSRACLAQLKDGKYSAVPLSDDQKPEREDEAKRIKEKGGRVQACKGMRGEDIGPQRVWLKHQDVPGLAMTRSFGDLIAASVGVIPRPEVWERKMEPEDAFMILASDGVWEFISNEEAVEIVANEKTPEAACKALVKESTKRWNDEEDVVDDITCLIVYFQ